MVRGPGQVRQVNPKVRHTPLPRGRVPVARPPVRAPWLLVGQERFAAHSARWLQPDRRQGSSSTTLADYAWPVLPVSADRLTFGLWTRILPSWLTLTFSGDRRSAASGEGTGVVLDVMAADGEAQIVRRGAVCEVGIGVPQPWAPFVRVELGYEFVGGPAASCEALYLLRLSERA